MQRQGFAKLPFGRRAAVDNMQVVTMKGGKTPWLRRSTLVGLGAVCTAVVGALVGVLALGVVSASAEVKHPFVGSITEANGSPLKGPWGMAFDGGGNLAASGAQAFAAWHKFSR
jgi:hypothetical protein